MSEFPNMITAKDLAKKASISLRLVRKLTASGELPYYRFGRNIRYSIDDLLERSKYPQMKGRNE